eukprot:jgi/Chrzof1/14621/Cz09g09230.t1_TEF5
MAATFSTQQHLIARRHTAFSSPRTQSCAKKHRSGLHSIVPYRRVHAHERCVLVRAAAEEKVEAKSESNASEVSGVSDDSNWIPVCKPEEVPKGVRREVVVDDKDVLIFWYRNQLYAIEARSPAEGAYSEGFIKAKFTQDFCIECPATGSLFSLKDGSIQAWYPNNPVLRALQTADLCRPMDVYPIKLTQEAIYVDVGSARAPKSRADRGGAGTSLEGNNVFTVQPNVYFEGQDPTQESASMYATGVEEGPINPATVTIGIVAVGIVAVAGTATAIYYENVIALAAFWIVLGGLVGLVGFNYVNRTQLPKQ